MLAHDIISHPSFHRRMHKQSGNCDGVATICICKLSVAHTLRDDLHHGDTFLKDKFTTPGSTYYGYKSFHILTDIIAQECLFDVFFFVI